MRQMLTSLRTLLRFKTYTVINLAGLVFSVACALIIVRYIHQERTVDNYCPELERTYVMTADRKGVVYLGGIDNLNKVPGIVDPLDDPAVDRVCNFFWTENVADKIRVGERGYNAQVLVTDSLFLQILPRPVVAGDVSMRNPTDVVITKSFADRLFGADEPLGKKLTLRTGEVVTVAGVVDEATTKASMTFDMIVPAHLKHFTDWGRVRSKLVQLHPAEDVKAFNAKYQEPMKLSDWDQPTVYQLMPLADMYMDTHLDTSYLDMVKRGNHTSLTILTIVAALLFLVGIFNYINLHTVVMLKRAREFGLKKVFGANGWQVFHQMYVENFCMGAIAVFMVWVVEEATRIPVRDWLGIPVVRDVAFDWWVSMALLFGIPLLTSIFPFLRYNFAAPINSLRSISMSGHSVVSRTVFIFLQYVITVCLIVAALYFSRQLSYVLHYDLNYQTEDIIRCSIWHETRTDFKTREEWEAYVEGVKQTDGRIRKGMDESPLFMKWAFGDSPVKGGHSSRFKTEDGQEHELLILGCDQRYMELLGYKLKEGRIWNDEEDEFKQYRVIVNEAMMRALGAESLQGTQVQLARRVWYSSGHDHTKNPPMEVVGVVEDFKVGHLSRPDIPFAFYYSEGEMRDELLASIVPGKRAEAIAFLENLYHELNGEGEFEYTFVEDDLAKLYEEDERTTHIYITFAVIAILISCLGLFGLSLYDIEQRHREIALRKIHGASTSDIVRLLLRKYYLILGIAFVLASAISYAAIHWYMQDYHHHAPISWWIFVLAGILITLISMGTIRWQIHKAVNMNPADVMKSE